MAATLKPYLDAVRASLDAALCLTDFPSQQIEKHNKPEVEMGMTKEVVFPSFEVARNEQEYVQIEPAINSVRVSIKIKQADGTEKLLAHKFARFIMMRAEQFYVLRRKPVEGFDLSFLITNVHLQRMHKEKLVDFVIHFMQDVDKEISAMKIALNARCRSVAEAYLTAWSRS